MTALDRQEQFDRSSIRDALGALHVMCISHSAISRVNGRLRYEKLLGQPELRVDLVMPDRWYERGRWQLPDPPRLDEDWVHALPIRFPNAGPASWHLHHYIGLEKLARRLQPDVIHLWEEPWSMVALQTLRLRCRLATKPSLVLEVDQNILKRLPAPFEQVRRAVLHRTDFVLGRTDDAIRVVQACGYRGPSARIGYGIDQSTFRPANRDASRAQLGFHGFTVGYVGRLIEEKGIDDLIEAVGRTTLPLTLAIMGEGPHRDALLQRCAARGIADRLRLMPWGPPEEVARFMRGLDVLALLTRTTRTVREQFGRVIIEAQACGTPVIGTCCGAIPEVIGDGGWIVPERDPATVTSLLERLAHRPAELLSARICAARQIAERFTFTAQARKLMTAWQVAARAAA